MVLVLASVSSSIGLLSFLKLPGRVRKCHKQEVRKAWTSKLCLRFGLETIIVFNSEICVNYVAKYGTHSYLLFLISILYLNRILSCYWSCPILSPGGRGWQHIHNRSGIPGKLSFVNKDISDGSRISQTRGANPKEEWPNFAENWKTWTERGKRVQNFTMLIRHC